jgi:hypothetical protein
MEPAILLAQLRALIERAPDLEAYTPLSKEHQIWLAQAHALIHRWNNIEAMSFKGDCKFLSNSIMKPASIGNIFGTIHRAIADLELQVPTETEVSFGAGDVYDFFQALNKVISSAESSIFIVDPYLDQSVFEHYLTSRGDNVSVRLLLNKKAQDLIPASEKYNEQHGNVLEVRKSKALHDRVIFIDGYVCWLIGQSIKDAATAKPTYLVQLSPDVVPGKLNNYEEIWSCATKL